MKVGDYVRIKDGNYSCIGKIKKIEKTNCTNIIIDYSDNDDFDESDYFDWNIKKSSPNIIDLIEVGDYVDGLRVVDKDENYIVVETFDERIVITKEDTIKSIVTKEMYSSVEYRVESH